MVLKLTLIGIEVLLGLFLIIYGIIHKSVLDIFFGGLLLDSATKHFTKF
jgi:hypothetical protein